MAVCLFLLMGVLYAGGVRPARDKRPTIRSSVSNVNFRALAHTMPFFKETENLRRNGEKGGAVRLRIQTFQAITKRVCARRFPKGPEPAAASGTGACRPLCGKKAGGTSGTTRSGESRDYVGSPEDEGGRNVWKRKGALARLFRFPDSCPNVPHREAIQEKSSQGAKRTLMGTLLKAAMILKTASVPRSPAILTIESSPFPQTVHIYTGVSCFPKTVHIDFRQTGFSPFDIDGYLPSLSP